MKRVRFTKDYDYDLNIRETVAYNPGHEATFAKEKADELVEKGVAEHLGEGVEDQTVETKRKKKA